MTAPEDRWLAAHAQREHAIAVARSRGLTLQEAEDVASEAVIRAAQKQDLDVLRVKSWLCVVARNLALDVVRARPKTSLLMRVHHSDPQVVLAQERVDDVAEARWVAARVAELPPRQRSVLERRAAGASVQRIADELQVPYKTVESLTSRGRATVRAALAACVAAISSVLAGARTTSRWTPPVATTLAGMIVLGAVSTSDRRLSPAPEAADSTQIAAAEMGEPVGRASLTPGSDNARAERAADQVQRAASRTTESGQRLVLVPRTELGPVAYSGAEHERTQGSDSLVTSVVTCVQQGIVVSVQHLGCADDGRPSSPR